MHWPAFHFECVSYARKSADEMFEITEPRLSVALSGTPDQVFRLIPSPEDGLFSRFLFYVFSTDMDWRDVSADEQKIDLIGFYQELSNEVLEMVEWLERLWILHYQDLKNVLRGFIACRPK